jgi:cbb3-type cytochrome oxidase maturation protein
MLWLIYSSIAFGLGGLMIYIYYLRHGQFDDPEDVKYQLFREEEEDR